MIVFQTSQVTLYQAHCLDVLRSLADESIDCVVTSPPYFQLRNYGLVPQAWGGSPTCEHIWNDWQEQREEREPALHGKSRTCDRFYGSRSRKFSGNHQKHIAGSTCVQCGAWLGELGQEPQLQQYIAHLVEVFAHVRRVLKPSGTVWLNLGDSYASKFNSELPPKNLMMIPHRVAIALQDSGWWVRNDNVWIKPNAMPESVNDRCTRAHEFVFQLVKSGNYFFNAEAIQEPASFNRWGGDRFEPNGKPHPKGLDRERSMFGNGHRNKRSTWAICTTPYPDAHFAVMPPEIPRLCILAGCPPNGTVLDPFAGSGTVLEVARDLGRQAVGIELSPQYCQLAERRCQQLAIWGVN